MVVVGVNVAVAVVVDDNDDDDDDDGIKATCNYLTQHVHFRQQHICATTSHTSHTAAPPPPPVPHVPSWKQLVPFTSSHP